MLCYLSVIWRPERFLATSEIARSANGINLKLQQSYSLTSYVDCQHISIYISCLHIQKFLITSTNLRTLKSIEGKYLKLTTNFPWLLLTISDIINLVTLTSMSFLDKKLVKSVRSQRHRICKCYERNLQQSYFLVNHETWQYLLHCWVICVSFTDQKQLFDNVSMNMKYHCYSISAITWKVCSKFLLHLISKSIQNISWSVNSMNIQFLNVKKYFGVILSQSVYNKT